MTDLASIKLAFFEAMFEEMYRSGIITDDTIAEVAKRAGSLERWHEGSPDADLHGGVAIAAAMLPMRATSALPSEHRARFERKQTRERTAMLARDGGKSPTK